MTAGTIPSDVPADIARHLTAVGQEHVVAWWGTLDATARDGLIEQLRAIDWNLVDQLRRRVVDRRNREPRAAPDHRLDDAVTPPCLRLHDEANPIAPAEARACGAASLTAGHVGAILVAGGQGSRLGFNGPKGIHAIGPVSGASLFQILIGKVAAVRRRYGRPVPLAIMTSSATDAATREFLSRHDWFGLSSDDVLVFRQHDLPALDDTSGDLLLDAPGHLATAPDGHGGMLTALAESGGLDWFASRGIEQIVSFQVDNPLALPLDAEFLGYHLLTRSEFTPQVVPKTDPKERVGAVVSSGGVTWIVEYSDLPEGLATARLPDGRLRFHAGSIAVHAFTTEFLTRCAGRRDALPLHMAHKAVPFIDSAGARVAARSPHAFKFERFIFDIMPLADRVTLVEVDPGEGFAPLKNAEGAATDTASQVAAAMVRQARRLLAAAGVGVADGVAVELAADRIIDASDVVGLFPAGFVITDPQVVGGR
ncbi:MAG: UTP--glucose-1-phosphate uridylyltransferase [Planctomycetia bacterium]